VLAVTEQATSVAGEAGDVGVTSATAASGEAAAQASAEASPWSLAALGRRLAEAAHGPRPHNFRHLPFGPYLAVGAMIVLFAHADVTREANLVFEALGLRDDVPFQIRYVDESGREVMLPARLPDLGLSDRGTVGAAARR
jgi:hypothetical protein